MDKIDELLTRGVANIIPNKEELKKKLELGKLNIYFGIDPTATKIHLGNAVPLRKLQKFAELGHNVTFLIGDSTALIGDTSDKDSERPSLSKEEIEENFQTYKKQAEKILDFTKVKIRHNSEWISKLDYYEIVRLIQKFSLGDFISRELIKKRLTEEKRIGLHEMIYPAIQAYDSWYLKTDLQIGGTDQTFNMQAGRTLIHNLDKRDSFVLTTPMLEGTDGRKMSKSWDNAIWLDDEPNEMYTKIMRIEDKLIINYFTLATNTPLKEIKKIEEELKNENPINVKKRLAQVIVDEIYGPKPSEEAQEDFENIVQRKEMPKEIETFNFGTEAFEEGRWLEDILVKTKLAESRSDAKRLIKQGGVEIDNVKALNPEQLMPVKNFTIKVGKRKFVKIIIE